MDQEEAKNLLELCRPGMPVDHSDPIIAEAFEMLDKDPELLAWFEAEQAVDERISASLNSIEPPAHLKSAILAGMRAHEAGATQTQSEEPEQPAAETIPFPTEQATSSNRNWFAPLIGIAAVFAVLFIAVTAMRSPEQSVANQVAATSTSNEVPEFVSFLNDSLANMKGLDKHGQRAAPLMTYLASNGAPSPEQLAEQIDDKQTFGCVVFDYQGAQVSMICFNDDGYYHIATMDKSDVNEPLPEEPAFYQIGDQTFKLWQEEEQVHILTMEGTEEDLPEFI